MPYQSAKIETKKIKDWSSFHTVFSQVMGFPDFYGGNLDAWIDCMTYMDDGMTRFNVPSDELFHLEIIDTKDFAKRLPEIYQALIEAVAFVNWRRMKVGDPPKLALILR